MGRYSFVVEDSHLLHSAGFNRRSQGGTHTLIPYPGVGHAVGVSDLVHQPVGMIADRAGVVLVDLRSAGQREAEEVRRSP